MLRSGGPLKGRSLALLAVKFPLLYGALLLLLLRAHVAALHFLAGFTAMLLALLVSALVTGAGPVASKRRGATASPADPAPRS